MDANIETWSAVAQLVTSGGGTAVLVAVLYGLMTGRLITGREHKVVSGELERVRAELDSVRGQHDALAAAATHALDRLAAGDDDRGR